MLIEKILIYFRLVGVRPFSFFLNFKIYKIYKKLFEVFLSFYTKEPL